MHHIHEDKDNTLAIFGGGGLEIRGDVEAIKCHAAEGKR